MLVIFFLNLPLRPDTIKRKLARIDYIGMILFIGSVFCLTTSSHLGWCSVSMGVPLIIRVVFLILTGFFECRFPREPMIPTSLFENRIAAASFIGSTLHGLIPWCLIYYLPFYYQTSKGYTLIISGVAMFPQTLTIITGHWYPHHSHRQIPLGPMARLEYQNHLTWSLHLKSTTSIRGWVFLNIVPSSGLGILFPAMISAIQASARKEDLSIAVATFVFF